MADYDEDENENREPSAGAAAGDVRGYAASIIRGLVGAALGAAVGYYGFFWIARQGLYALILPGALLGLGCGALSGRRSMALGIVCGVLAVALGVYIEWRFAPFVEDAGFGYFVAHLHELTPVTRIMIGLGGFLAFWFGLGRKGGVWHWRRRAQRPPGENGQ